MFLKMFVKTENAHKEQTRKQKDAVFFREIVFQDRTLRGAVL